MLSWYMLMPLSGEEKENAPLIVSEMKQAKRVTKIKFKILASEIELFYSAIAGCPRTQRDYFQINLRPCIM